MLTRARQAPDLVIFDRCTFAINDASAGPEQAESVPDMRWRELDGGRSFPAHANLVHEWLDDWEDCIRQCDFERGRLLFDLDVMSFGTRAAVALGLDELEGHQWRRIWPFIDDFRFDRNTMRIASSPDDLFATLALTWSSNAFDEKRASFVRPGRATVVLKRSTTGEPWRAVHTHFSLNCGVLELSTG